LLLIARTTELLKNQGATQSIWIPIFKAEGSDIKISECRMVSMTNAIIRFRLKRVCKTATPLEKKKNLSVLNPKGLPVTSCAM
jgi:hypothetical protein